MEKFGNSQLTEKDNLWNNMEANLREKLEKYGNRPARVDPLGPAVVARWGTGALLFILRSKKPHFMGFVGLDISFCRGFGVEI